MKDNLDEALMFDFATARDHEAERMVRTPGDRRSQGGRAGLYRQAQAGVQRELSIFSRVRPYRSPDGAKRNPGHLADGSTFPGLRFAPSGLRGYVAGALAKSTSARSAAGN